MKSRVMAIMAGAVLVAGFLAFGLVDTQGGQDEKLLGTVISFLKEDEWKFERMEGVTAVKMGYKGNNGTWRCIATTKEDAEQFFFYSVSANSVPENKRKDVSEYITRANYGLNIGNFEMDFTDGEVRYKCSVDVEGSTLTHTMIKNMVLVNVLTMDKYLPGLNKVIFADITPEDAIKSIETK